MCWENRGRGAATKMVQVYMLLLMGPPPRHRVVRYEGPFRQRWRLQERLSPRQNRRFYRVVVAFESGTVLDPDHSSDETTDSDVDSE